MTISAKIIADSISSEGVRLTTLETYYPEFIHGEVLTHRAFSRNSSSTRAIPVERMIEQVLRDPAMPTHWGAAQKGMQADEECYELIAAPSWLPGGGQFMTRENAWRAAARLACHLAATYKVAGYHKQVANQLLRPFMHQTTLITATDWDNFFTLRLHRDARPEIRELAEKMKAAMDASTPKTLWASEWHLPYLENEDWVTLHTNYRAESHIHLARKISAARCARVSYKTVDGKRPNFHEDVSLFYRLFGTPPHLSPMEHQATPMYPDYSGSDMRSNFSRWVQSRKLFEQEKLGDVGRVETPASHNSGDTP